MTATPPHHTHLCLVSAQATPNLLPLLDDNWRPKHVVLACTAQMKDKAHSLRAVVQTKGGTTVELLDLPDAYDYTALAETFMTWLGQHEHSSVALNVTGGTKLMAVAAQEVFRSDNRPVFYVSVETDEIIHIGHSSKSQPLQAKLKVHELLKAHGYTVFAQDAPQVTRELRDLTARLIDHVASAGRALGTFNALAQQAKNNHLRAELSPQQQDSRALSDIVALFQEAGLLRQHGSALVFTNEQARFFANGGWLETHVFNTLQGLRPQYPGLTDVTMGLRVAFAQPGSKQPGPDKNELDVAFLYRNTLHIIECKTANLGQTGTGTDSKATEALYKMESLLKLGGLRTKGMVVDYRGDFSKSEANQKRAKDVGIAIASGPQLRDLKGHIQRLWLDKKPAI